MEQTWMPESIGTWVSTYIVILIIYYVLLARTILQMLSAKANQVMLVFAYLALFPAPPVVVMGIVMMIIWAIHK